MDSKKTVYPYIPNSAPDVQAEMMAEVGISDVMELYEEIPEAIRYQGALNLPEAIPDEQGIKRHIERILSKNKNCNEFSNFMGAGCAQHYVPAVCDEIASRGELLTTYGAETWADHGKYQIFFEYQSLMAELLDMSFLTVPCHCGGQASATGLRMACRITGRNKVLLPHTMNRQNLALVRNYLKMIDPDQEIKIELVACRSDTGMLDLEDLKSRLDQDTAAVYIENPTFLGIIETQGEEIGKLAKAAGAEFIVYTDPISLGVLEAPANYGATICVGDLHGLGLHLNFGGGQAGFIASHDDMRYITEFKELVDGMVETTVPGETGLFGCAHRAHPLCHEGKRKRIYRNPEQSVDRARGCLPVPHGPERHGGNRPYHYDQRKIRSQKAGWDSRAYHSGFHLCSSRNLW